MSPKSVSIPSSSSFGGGLAVQIEVESQHIEALLNRFELATSLESMVTFFEEKGVPWLRTQAAKRFKGEGDSSSGRWAPLKPYTVQRRREGRLEGLWDVGDSHPINQRTHELQNYIMSGDGNTVPLVQGARLLFPGGSPSPSVKEKISTAQKGTARPQTVPRPVLAIGPTDVEFFLTSLKNHIFEAADI